MREVEDHDFRRCRARFRLRWPMILYYYDAAASRLMLFALRRCHTCLMICFRYYVILMRDF